MKKSIATLGLFFLLQFVFSQNMKNLDVVEDHNGIRLPESELVEFKTLTRHKVNELQRYIELIGNKHEDEENRKMAINGALRLFIDDATMQVSSNNSNSIRAYPMQKYFFRLMALKYDKVEIEFYDVSYITELTHGEDGKYRCTATIYQRFKGYTGDQLVYTDETTKRVEIVLEYKDDEFYREKRWILLLGDVEVSETS